MSPFQVIDQPYTAEENSNLILEKYNNILLDRYYAFCSIIERIKNLEPIEERIRLFIEALNKSFGNEALDNISSSNFDPSLISESELLTSDEATIPLNARELISSIPWMEFLNFLSCTLNGLLENTHKTSDILEEIAEFLNEHKSLALSVEDMDMRIRYINVINLISLIVPED